GRRSVLSRLVLDLSTPSMHRRHVVAHGHSRAADFALAEKLGELMFRVLPAANDSFQFFESEPRLFELFAQGRKFALTIGIVAGVTKAHLGEFAAGLSQYVAEALNVTGMI